MTTTTGILYLCLSRVRQALYRWVVVTNAASFPLYFLVFNLRYRYSTTHETVQDS